MDVDAVLIAIQATKCFVQMSELEQAPQVQLQDFDQPGIKVWTGDVNPAEGLTPQDTEDGYGLPWRV